MAIPYWQALVARAKACGVERFALENFSAMLVWNPETLFRLREAVGPMVGLNLDPSHLLWMGADPIAVARALGPTIHHVHGKDVRLERGVVEVNGLLETKPIDDVAGRAWNYVAVGCGQDLQWWKAFFSVVRMMGYNDWVSLEMEDLTMSVDAGIVSSRSGAAAEHQPVKPGAAVTAAAPLPPVHSPRPAFAADTATATAPSPA